MDSPVFTREQVERLERLFFKGYSLNRMARETGWNKREVNQALRLSPHFMRLKRREEINRRIQRDPIIRALETESGYPGWPEVYEVPAKVTQADGKEVVPSVHNRLERQYSQDKRKHWLEEAGCFSETETKGSRGEADMGPFGSRWPGQRNTGLREIREEVQRHLEEAREKVAA